MTGFARFMFIMILIAPLAYIGASYYNGEDGVQNIKNLLNRVKKTETMREESAVGTEAKPVNQSPSTKALEEENLRLKEQLEFKSKRVDELYRETEELKRRLESSEKALEESKKK